MHVNRIFPWINFDHLLLCLANPDNGGLKHFLNEHTFLWMADLIITFLHFLINVNILDVKGSIVLEEFITRVPVFEVLDPAIIPLYRNVLNFDLFTQVVHCVVEHHVVRPFRKIKL